MSVNFQERNFLHVEIPVPVVPVFCLFRHVFIGRLKKYISYEYTASAISSDSRSQGETHTVHMVYVEQFSHFLGFHILIYSERLTNFKVT